MNRNIKQVLVLVAVLGMLSASMTGTVAAQSDSSSVSVLERISAANNAISGLVDKLSFAASKAAVGVGLAQPKSNVTVHADNFESVANENNKSLEKYASERFDGDASNYDVIKVEFESNGETATRYVTATAVNTSDFDDMSVVKNTSRTVDGTVTLGPYAASNADDELSKFVSEYVANDRDIDHSLRVRLLQQYMSDIQYEL